MKPRTIRYLHRLAALLVGWQLLIWLTTGLYFNLTPHEELKGSTYLATQSQAKVPKLSQFTLLEPATILERHSSTETLSLIWLNQRPYYLLSHRTTRYAHQCQQQSLVDASTGLPYQLNAEDAASLASASYSGPGQVVATNHIPQNQSEWPKQCNALWQVQFNDTLHTRVYLDARSGQLIGHKNRHTEVADLMWRLHFMDLFNQGSFNQPLAWLMALLSLGLVYSGGGLIIQDWRKKRRYNKSLIKAASPTD